MTGTGADAAAYERAMAVCERLAGGWLCFNDFSNRLVGSLPAERIYHTRPYCLAVKHTPGLGSGACLRCDREGVINHARKYPAGFFKVCPGLVLEYVVPLWEGSRLLGALYLGPYRMAPDTKLPGSALQQLNRRRLPARVAKLREQLPRWGKMGMDDLAELAAMLAGRLERLLSGAEPPAAGEQDRAARIRRFLDRNFVDRLSLGDLAGQLHLSASRTGHVVKDLFGVTFPELVRRERLARAGALLRETTLSVREIAYHVGFADPTYFHRVFRHRHGLTPLAYRRRRRRTGETNA